MIDKLEGIAFGTIIGSLALLSAAIAVGAVIAVSILASKALSGCDC